MSFPISFSDRVARMAGEVASGEDAELPRIELPPKEHAGPTQGFVDTTARRMMENMGWSAGEGLGRDAQGIATAIDPKSNPKRAGLKGQGEG